MLSNAATCVSMQHHMRIRSFSDNIFLFTHKQTTLNNPDVYSGGVGGSRYIILMCTPAATRRRPIYKRKKTREDSICKATSLQPSLCTSVWVQLISLFFWETYVGQKQQQPKTIQRSLIVFSSRPDRFLQHANAMPTPQALCFQYVVIWMQCLSICCFVLQCLLICWFVNIVILLLGPKPSQHDSSSYRTNKYIFLSDK